MANVKTAVSIPNSLFKQTEAIARKMKISRSRLFAIALEDFIKRHKNRDLVEAINRAYDEGLDADEKTLLRMIRRNQKKLSEGEW